MGAARHQPVVLVIGGPNGAGKTTLALSALADRYHITSFVNSDLIAQGLSPLAPEKAALAAGRLVLQEVRRLAGARENFAFESTLSGRAYAPFLRDLKSSGYRVCLIYFWIYPVELAIARVHDRVMLGGHDVPEADIRRRYPRSARNFLAIYRLLADEWRIY